MSATPRPRRDEQRDVRRRERLTKGAEELYSEIRAARGEWDVYLELGPSPSLDRLSKRRPTTRQDKICVKSFNGALWLGRYTAAGIDLEHFLGDLWAAMRGK